MLIAAAKLDSLRDNGGPARTHALTGPSSVAVDPTTGLVFVAGSVTCSTDDTFDLAVEVTQQQKVGRGSTVVKAAGKVSVTCSATAKPWGLALAPSTGAFSNGNAVVTTKTAAAPWVTPATATTPVNLYWGHR